MCTAVRASQETNGSAETYPKQEMIRGTLKNMSELIKQEAHKYQQIILAI